MVRLVEWIDYTDAHPEINFNSSMVRLVVRYRTPQPLWVVLFQFQYGAIGSESNGLYQNVTDKFQFQYGAIGRRMTKEGLKSFPQISIPVWCDW